MRIGVIFPQTEIGTDRAILRDYIHGVEALGYEDMALYDHVLGATPERLTGTRATYNVGHQFHEPLVFLAWVAAQTQRLGLTTCILILPQRQTALVAKQSAELDILSGGRLRLGVGIGWNHVEYEALGENFRTRGRRMESQVQALRKLWSEPVVDFKDRFHTIVGAGINPLPSKQIPVWMGGGSEVVMRRAARMADGWFPQILPDDNGKAAIERMREYLRAEGRDPAALGIEGRVTIERHDIEWQVEQARRWQDLGVSHLCVNTMGGSLEPHQHLEALRRFKEALEAAGLPAK